MGMAHAGGRPLKFKDVEELQTRIDEFFESDEQPLITSLALWLDTDRKVLIDYEERPEFSNTIKKAKLRCEQYVEQKLMGTGNATGAIFNLKNNYGWVDKTEQDITSKGEQINTGPDSVAAASYAAFLKGQK